MRKCGICFKDDVRLRYWFGGLSCNCCKYFFIRFVQNTNIQRCRNNRACFNGQGQFSCRPCRYLRCLQRGMKPYFVGRIHEPLDYFIERFTPDKPNYIQDFSKMPALIPIPRTTLNTCRVRKRLRTESVNLKTDEGKLMIDENPENGDEAKDDEYPSNE